LRDDPSRQRRLAQCRSAALSQGVAPRCGWAMGGVDVTKLCDDAWRIFTRASATDEGNLLALHPTVKPVAMVAKGVAVRGAGRA
jgi:hypothetical protein